jgi:hypothetical protein
MHTANTLQHAALKLYSIVCNSMCEERTVSFKTRINTALRNRQGIQTQVDQAQINQYYRTKKQARFISQIVLALTHRSWHRVQLQTSQQCAFATSTVF